MTLNNVEFTFTSGSGYNVLSLEMQIDGMGTDTQLMNASTPPGSPLFADVTLDVTGSQVSLMGVNFTGGRLHGSDVIFSYFGGLVTVSLTGMESELRTDLGGGFFAPVLADSGPGSFDPSVHITTLQAGTFHAVGPGLDDTTLIHDPDFARRHTPGSFPTEVEFQLDSTSGGMATYKVTWTMEFFEVDPRTISDGPEMSTTTMGTYQGIGYITVPIPEPTGGMLSAVAALGLLLVRRRGVGSW